MGIFPHLNPRCRGTLTRVAIGQWAPMSGCDRFLEAVTVAVRQEDPTHA